MALIERHITIAAPLGRVYGISQDYSVRYLWDPFPEEIAVISGPSDGISVGS